MATVSVLIVDDDVDLCEILSFNLLKEGYDVRVAHSSHEAIKMIDETTSLILLDVMMPGMSGFDFARLIKEDKLMAAIPIIFLTALDSEHDTLTGFNIGADDYISKPFSIKEMLARVKAVLSRTTRGTAVEHSELIYQGLVLDPISKTMRVDGTKVDLTKTEFIMLEFLLRHKGMVFSREDLLKNVWPEKVVVTPRTVDVNITRLRKKMGQYASHVITKTGYGYSFEP